MPDSNQTQIEAAPIRRVFSGTLDLVVVIVPTLIVQFSKGAFSLFEFLGIAWFLFTVMTIAMTVTTGLGTFGDVIGRLKTVDVRGTDISKKKLLLRNVCYCVLWAFPLIDVSDHLYLIISSLTSLGFSLTFFLKENKYKKYMSVFDLLFKTFVVLRPNRR